MGEECLEIPDQNPVPIALEKAAACTLEGTETILRGATVIFIFAPLSIVV